MDHPAQDVSPSNVSGWTRADDVPSARDKTARRLDSGSGSEERDVARSGQGRSQPLSMNQIDSKRFPIESSKATKPVAI